MRQLRGTIVEPAGTTTRRPPGGLRRTEFGREVGEADPPTFLKRPGKPHLSLFAEDCFDLHFTANGGRPNVIRPKLVRVRAETAKAFVDRATDAALRHHAGALSPANLDALAEEGWTAHFPHWPALARWLAPSCKPGATLNLDEDALGSIILSVCRRWVSPRQLAPLDG